MFNVGLGGQSQKSDVTFFLPLTGAVAEAPPVAEKARRGRRSGQNLPCAPSRQILGTARGPEVARAQRVTEGEANQIPIRVVAGFPGQNSEFRGQRSERVVAGFCACCAQFDTDTRPGCAENKIPAGVGRGLAPRSDFRIQISDVRTVGRGLAPAATPSDTDTRTGGDENQKSDVTFPPSSEGGKVILTFDFAETYPYAF